MCTEVKEVLKPIAEISTGFEHLSVPEHLYRIHTVLGAVLSQNILIPVSSLPKGTRILVYRIQLFNRLLHGLVFDIVYVKEIPLFYVKSNHRQRPVVSAKFLHACRVTEGRGNQKQCVARLTGNTRFTRYVYVSGFVSEHVREVSVNRNQGTAPILNEAHENPVILLNHGREGVFQSFPS